jgi:hypothetical protein
VSKWRACRGEPRRDDAAQQAPPPTSAASGTSDGDRRGWLQLAAIPPLFSATEDEPSAMMASGGGGGALDSAGRRAGGGGGGGSFGLDESSGGGFASLSSPVPGLLASVKNLALRQEAPRSAANAGYGDAPPPPVAVAGGAAGGWMGGGGGSARGAGAPRGEADCALRCDTQPIHTLLQHTAYTHAQHSLGRDRGLWRAAGRYLALALPAPGVCPWCLVNVLLC